MFTLQIDLYLGRNGLRDKKFFFEMSCKKHKMTNFD